MNYTFTKLGQQLVTKMSLERSARFKHYMRNLQKEGKIKQYAIEQLHNMGLCNKDGTLSELYFEVI